MIVWSEVKANMMTRMHENEKDWNLSFHIW